MIRAMLALLVAGTLAGADAFDEVAAAAAAHAGLDVDGDGEAEIEALAPLGRDHAAEAPGDDLAVVLVEERLTAAPAAGTDLRPSLAQYVGDLAAEGLDAVVVAARVYAGPRHQDGRTVIALRRFLQEVQRRVPGLRACVLVGAFPDAFLVRQYAWWKREPITLGRGTPNEKSYAEPIDFLRSVPEPVALRCDLILADLDGDWEKLYALGPDELPYWYLAFPQGRDRAGEGADGLEHGTLAFEDYFLVNDGRLELTTLDNGKVAAERRRPWDEELSPADRELGNPIARPDIWVSRLDARNAGAMPDPNVVDAEGRRLLDDQGRPQALTFATPEAVPHPLHVWVRDETSERRMLADWLDRRHRYRLGEFADAFRPASMDTGWGSALPALRAAFAPWAGFDDPAADVVRGDVRLDELVDWLKLPAVARAMKAHGDPWGCAWGKAADPAALDEACGPVIWNWGRDGNRFVPTLAQTSGKLDFAVTRSLYENGGQPDDACVWLYTSCEGTAPEGATNRPYTHPRYGFWQGGECILFHLRGLALVGRSKVFYDEPREFWKVLGAGGTVGEAYRHYFDLEAADAQLDEENGIGCKRSYFWCILGDATVRVKPPA